jgi:hypothetical protein
MPEDKFTYYFHDGTFFRTGGGSPMEVQGGPDNSWSHYNGDAGEVRLSGSRVDRSEIEADNRTRTESIAKQKERPTPSES